MAIKKPLPATGRRERGSGVAPDDNPALAHALTRRWQRDRQAESKRRAERADYVQPAPVWFSAAGSCARKLGYQLAGHVEEEPMDLPGVWVTSLGTKLHDLWQEAIFEELKDVAYVTVEAHSVAEYDGRPIAYGRADTRIDFPTLSVEERAKTEIGSDEDLPIWIRHEGKRVVAELKTTGGFGYKIKVGERGTPEGPSFENVMQLALQVWADNADIGILVYLPTEAISKPAAARKKLTELDRCGAEWTYDRATLIEHAERELKRLARIIDIVDGGELPARMIPNPEVPFGAEITDPSKPKGLWTLKDENDKVLDAGDWWGCGYCSFKAQCTADGPGRVRWRDEPVDELDLDSEEE